MILRRPLPPGPNVSARGLAIVTGCCGALLMLAGGLGMWATSVGTVGRALCVVVLIIGAVMFGWRPHWPRARGKR